MFWMFYIFNKIGSNRNLKYDTKELPDMIGLSIFKNF